MSTSETHTLHWGKIGFLLLIVSLLIGGGLLAYQALSPQQIDPDPQTIERITAAELEERHGLRVHLIGVTAGGGMIDFRLKITDAEKARRLLEDPANLPEIIVVHNNYQLMSPEGLDDDIEFSDGGILFNFYPNDKGIVQSGTLVIVKFGNEYLERQAAQ